MGFTAEDIAHVCAASASLHRPCRQVMTARAFIEWACAIAVARRDATALALRRHHRYMEVRFEADVIARPARTLSNIMALVQPASKETTTLICEHVQRHARSTVRPDRAASIPSSSLPLQTWQPAIQLLRDLGYIEEE